jgi:hypothetical protein
MESCGILTASTGRNPTNGTGCRCWAVGEILAAVEAGLVVSRTQTPLVSR